MLDIWEINKQTNTQTKQVKSSQTKLQNTDTKSTLALLQDNRTTLLKDTHTSRSGRWKMHQSIWSLKNTPVDLVAERYTHQSIWLLKDTLTDTPVDLVAERYTHQSMWSLKDTHTPVDLFAERHAPSELVAETDCVLKTITTTLKLKWLESRKQTFGKYHKIALCADYNVVFKRWAGYATGSQNFAKISTFSGSEMNQVKSEAMWVGSKQNCADPFFGLLKRPEHRW